MIESGIQILCGTIQALSNHIGKTTVYEISLIPKRLFALIFENTENTRTYVTIQQIHQSKNCD